MSKPRNHDYRTVAIPDIASLSFVAAQMYEAWWSRSSFSKSRDVSFHELVEKAGWDYDLDDIDASLRWLVDNKFVKYVPSRNAYYGVARLNGLRERLKPKERTGTLLVLRENICLRSII